MADASSTPEAKSPPGVRICALLPEVETALSTLQCATAAGKGFEAALCAAHVGFDPKHASVDAEERDVQQLRDLREGSPEARTARIKAALDTFVASSPSAPQIRWRGHEGEIGAGVVLEACDADLIVIGRPAHLDAADALHSALFDARRLVLIAPRAAVAERSIGRHIVIGWKPGRAVEQTVEAALPWLAKAEKVSVAFFQKSGAEPYDASARVLLNRLGVAAEVVRIEPGGERVGAQLLAATARLGGDCLLIGAFQHGSLWEALLGGVTRYVLTKAELPVFMMRAH
jgi:nucleotide-binding universal stress UspA family protein